MKINKLIWVILLIAVVLALSACGSVSGTQTPPATRGATQTPIYIYVPVTVTPEPATITPLPTAVVASNNTPTRTPTKAAAVKTATRTPTKAPVALAPAASATPSCNLGTVEPFFPEDGVRRELNPTGTSGPAFEFKWTTPLGAGPTDPLVGYRITITSKRGGQTVGGDTVYVSHNKFLETNKYVYEGTKVRLLAAGDNANVTWQVTIIRVSGGFDDQGGKTGSEINCGAPSRIMSIGLVIL